MLPTPKFLFVFAVILYAFYRLPDKFKVSASQSLKRWGPVFGLIALVAAFVILLNPELIALGLVGDTAFFDFLVLAISFQMQGWVTRAWNFVVNECRPFARFVVAHAYCIYLVLISLPLAIFWALAEIAAPVQDIIHRLRS